MKRTQKIFSLLFVFGVCYTVFTAEACSQNLPHFKYCGVVLQASQLKYAPHDDVIYPAVFTTEKRIEKPLGKYYMYYAPHDAPGGICLAYADQPEGTWKEYAENPVISKTWEPHYRVSHVSGPDVIWNDEEKKLFLYFHGENNVTRLASSEDGIHFRYECEVINTKMFPSLSEASYGRVFKYVLPGKNNKYIMLLMGNDRGTRRIYLAWSLDGRAWETRPGAVMDPPPGTDQTAGAVLFLWNGKIYIVAHANNSRAAFNEGYDLYIGETDVSLEKVQPLGKIFERTAVFPENPAVMSPTLIELEGRLHMYFNIGSRLKNKIAMAVAE
ncbi:MAG: hypothetical protein LBJ67_02920 [Planctomycetaceae bacterium]|jgi:hypothetical protein|nr:hypothetical protein [Planctomycetaceae bacterium]